MSKLTTTLPLLWLLAAKAARWRARTAAGGLLLAAGELATAGGGAVG